MKKKISLLLAILMLVTLIPTAFAESKTVDAVKNTKKITLDGEEVKVGSYDVEGYNYLKLRDVAAILNTKKCQFNIGFDKPTKLITVELAKGYEKVEGDLAEIKDEKAKAIVSVKKILVNGEEKEIKTALINEYNYMQLRDLGSLVGLDVKYDAKNKVIMLKSDAQAKEEEKTDEKTEEKKDDKKEDKKDEKKDENKDEKKDEKKEEVKTEAKIEEVPEDNWTKKEKDFFETYKSISEFLTKALNYDSKVVSDETLRDILKYYQKLHETSLIQGRELFNGSPLNIKTRVEKRADGRYAVIELIYSSGGIYKAERKNADSEDAKTKDYFNNVLILELEDGAKEKYTDNKLIYAKLIDFHQAIVDNNLDEAVKILQSIGVKANAENVKEYIDTRKQTAKNLGAEIFTKDFEYTKEYTKDKDDDGNDVIVIFNYKDGSMLFIGYSKTVGGVNGFGMKLNK